MLTLINGSSSPRLERSQRAQDREDRLNPDLVGTSQCCNTAVRQSDNLGKAVYTTQSGTQFNLSNSITSDDNTTSE